MKVALVYDRINKWGGAERVLLALHEMFPKASLYTAVHDKRKTEWAEIFNIETSFLQKFPWAKSHHEFYPWLTPLAFESLNFDGYDLVISVTSAEAKGIITKPETLHICYCLTPTRYLWSHYRDYFKNRWFRWLTSGIVTKLRIWDQVAASRPDYYVAVSKRVADRIKKYYKREAEVIYPPVVAPMHRSMETASKSESSENFFLVISRLVPYKRVDLAIEAFNKLGLPLVVVGRGVEERRLRALAYKNITFLKDLTDGQLNWYYQHCRALIMPQEEDFGLVAVEAQAFGKPVIAYKAGGALETVVEGKTGTFFFPQTKEALIEVVKHYDNTKYRSKICKKNAKRFSKEEFKRKFGEFIDNCYNSYKNYNRYKL